MSRVIIAGTGSGCGKTTVICAILKSLKDMNKNPISFKCGPDYIDPMFHREAIGVASRNLDIFMVGEENVKYLLSKNSKGYGISIIEGAMGLYDGVGDTSFASVNHLSLITNTPVVLVVNVRGKSRSVCAEISGYLNFDENNIKGVVLNNANEITYEFYKNMIEKNLGVSVIGYMPNIPASTIESRHLGLVTAQEIHNIKEKIATLANCARDTIDFDSLFNIAALAKPFDFQGSAKIIKAPKKTKIYVSKDKAFSFYYEDNLDLLESLGAELAFFSPLEDTHLPKDACGVVLWGGYPEVYAKELSSNVTMLSSLKEAAKRGVPIYGECGGFMYLQESITDINGNTYPMAGVIKGHASMTKKLQHFGYMELVAEKDNIMCKAGDSINVHEFHYSTTTAQATTFTATKKSNNNTHSCSIATENVLAGYPHLNFWGNPKFAEDFINKCYEYGCKTD